MPSFSRTIHLIRICSQNTNAATTTNHVQSMIENAFKDRRGKGWTWKMDVVEPEQLPNRSWVHQRNVTLEKKSVVGEHEAQFSEIVKAIGRDGTHQRFNKYPWIVCHGPNDIEALVKGIDEPVKELEPIQVNTDPGNLFDNIYDRQHQVSMLLSAIKAGAATNWEDRHHCVLYGPPGCGKTHIALTMGQMLGNEDEHYICFDATSLTEAGITKVFSEMGQCPPVIIIEELEKAPEHSLRWLLGLMDSRAEIRRTNYRIGNTKVKVKSLVVATVNNMGLFRTAMAGALSSRFSHEIYCPRPSRLVLGKILAREIERVGGDMRWIEPTLQLCHDDFHLNDPRKIIPVCLCGRDDLLTGAYQEAYRQTRENVTPVPVKTEATEPAAAMAA